LHRIEIPANVEYISRFTFDDCPLDTVIFHSSATDIHPHAFSSAFTAFVPYGASFWYIFRLPPSCTIIETDFEQNIDIEQENDLTL
jgi:hypothetical protein